MLIAAEDRRTLVRGCSRAVHTLLRERRWGTTLTLLTLIMVLLQLVVSGLLAAAGARSALRERGAIRLEVKPGAPDQDVQELFAALKEHTGVDMVSYIPHEKALEEEKVRNPDLVSSLQKFRLANPFPDAFIVSLASLNAYDSFLQLVSADRWKSVIDPAFLPLLATQRQELDNSLSAATTVSALLKLLLFLGLAIVFALVLELVSRRAARRRPELLLESLLGAMPLTILTPFVAEVTILLLLALAAATPIVVLLLLLLPFLMPALDAPLTIWWSAVSSALWAGLPLVFLLEIVLLPVMALCGTLLGVRAKHLWPLSL